MSSTTNLTKDENKASLFAQPYIENENQNVEPEKGGCDGEREADIYSVTSGELSDISGSDTSVDISDTSDEIFLTSDPPTKKKSHLTKIVNALKSLRPRHSDQLFYLRTEKKYFGPNSSKPNFFGSKTKAQLNSPKSSEEQLKSGSDTSQTENQQKSSGKVSPKNSAKITTRKTSLKEAPKKTDKVLPPSKIPRISDDNGAKTTLKKSATPSKVTKTEDSHGKTPDESQAKKEIKTAKAKPVNGKPITKQHEEALRKRPPSVEKAQLSRSRPPSEKVTDVKKPSSVQGARPSSRTAATPRVSTGKKDQDSETKKKQRLSNSTSSSTESARERKPSPEKTPISLVKDERYNPPQPKVDQSLVDQDDKKKPNNPEQVEMFEEVKEQPKELSFLERLQQNVKSYFSPRASETVRMETTVEPKKKVSDGARHHPTTSKGTKKHPAKTHPKIPENVAELEIKNINFEDPASTSPRRSTTPKEITFKREETPQTTPPTTSPKIVRKKSSVKSTASISKATSASAGLCDSCHRISKNEILCDCQCRHHSEQLPPKKSFSSGVIKQRLSRHSSALLKEALLSLSSDHCHRRSRPDLIYEHSSKCKLMAAKRSAKWAEKQQKDAAKKLEKTSKTEVKETAATTAPEDAKKEVMKNTTTEEKATTEKATTDSTVIAKHFVAPDLFKESSHDFLGKDNEIVDIIEEEEDAEEKKEDEEGKISLKANANSSPDIVPRKIPESSSYYFIKALLNDTGKYKISLARSDTFPQQYLMDTKVEPLDKNKSQAPSLDSERRKSKERKESDLERRKSGSAKSEADRRKSGESSKSEAERKKSRESRKSDADRRKSRESSTSNPGKRKSGESSKIEPEKGRLRENSASRPGRRTSGGSQKSETERRKSKSRVSDFSQKLDVLTYKIGRRSVIYWMPKYEVKIEIYDKNPLTNESGYLKVFRVEHDPITPNFGVKKLSLEKGESRKVSVEESKKESENESRKESMEKSRKGSLAERRKSSADGSKKGSFDSGRKASSEGNRKPSAESRRLSIIESKSPSRENTKQNSVDTTLELLEPLEPRVSVWQSSKLEMVKELNEVPKNSIAPEHLLEFHTSSSINADQQKPGKRSNACSRMSCLKIFQSKKSKQASGTKIPEIIITQPEEEEEGKIETRRASTSSKKLESNPLKTSAAEISKIPRDSSPEDDKKNKHSKHSLSLRIFGGKKSAQKKESNESTTSNQAGKYLSGPSYTVQHCSIRIDTTSMIIPMITEPTLYDFSAKLLRPKTSKLKFSLMDEKYSKKMEGGEGKLIHKKILQKEEDWHYDFKYKIKKIRPESCPTYHSQRTIVQQIVWPNKKSKMENRTEGEKTIKKLKKKPLKNKRRKISSAGAECPKKLSEIVVKRVIGVQAQVLEYCPKLNLLGMIIMGQQKMLQVITREKWKLCSFSIKITSPMILDKVKYESIVAESTRLKICQKMAIQDIPQATLKAHIISPLPLIELQRLHFEDVSTKRHYAAEIFTEWVNFSIYDRQLYTSDRSQIEAMRIPSWVSLYPETDFPNRRKKVKNLLEQKSSREVCVKRKNSSKKSMHLPIKEVKAVEELVQAASREEVRNDVSTIQNDGKNEDLKRENLVRDIPITPPEMSLVAKIPELPTHLDRAEKFPPIFQEETITLINHKTTNAVGSAFTKSLDSIVLNLTQAMKSSKYWDNSQRKNETDNKNLISKKSSVMISVVDYLESQISLPDKTELQTDDDKIISIYKYEEEKHKSDFVQIFKNKSKLNGISKVRQKSSVWIKVQESKVATTTEIYNPPLPYVKTILENVTRPKESVLYLIFFENDQEIAEMREIEYELCAIIHPWQKSEVFKNGLEAIREEFIETQSNYQILTCDDNDENLEFFDAVDFRPNNPEIICNNIIANLKDYKNDSLKCALTLLEDLVKENQKHKGKKLLNPKKIKESLHELNDAFGLYEKRSQMDLQSSERSQEKEVKCFSDILKVLESVTNLVKLQLKEKRMEKESLLDYQSAVSVIKGEDFEIQPKNLKEEMMETFGLLKAYSEKAKRLIMEFKARPKEKEIVKESVDYYCQKKCESFSSYFKENVENIEF